MKKIIILFSFIILFTNSFSEKTIVLATDEWEPYYGNSLKNQGILSEIVREALKEEGYNCEIKFMPWKRVLALVKEGIYDAVLGGYYSVKREEDYLFTDKILDVTVSFFSYKNIKYNTLKDLKGYKIGVVSGYFYTEEFEKSNLKKIKVSMAKNLIKIYKAGIVDVIAVENRVFKYYMRGLKNNRYKNKIGELSTNSLHLLFTKKNKDSEKMVKDFNAGLKKIRKNGKFDEILKRFEKSN
ncbi:substrate-binding periplasmic protein [Haliovirga abyssi]|uniref:ABC transporter substrate-binding protein n=1 Tax=Haliovirga abyssi TaxID=2996794 RepID=A0AAU9DL17_9FUSO|nr:transporter substrate-binding domain-containing protein [Haliovirga abyssi]BDU50607.1 ABC transporter substrate-binding protein [Haliovirga abyssi]